ncbi:hypothetical protein F4818DRAFT_312522 [Hypoxylon cercidicola]|nr:hypothetical protein F4818DRAFT_312522 [Hypoxylon cercidicola]
MNHAISTNMTSRCSTGPFSAATQALDVFASYCSLENASKYTGANATRAVTANGTYHYRHSNRDAERVFITARTDSPHPNTVELHCGI